MCIAIAKTSGSDKIMAALVLIKMGCLQFYGVYTGVLSHLENSFILLLCLFVNTAADPGGGSRGPWPPPVPVKTSHKKDGRHWRPLIFHVSCPPPSDHAGSDAEISCKLACLKSAFCILLDCPASGTIFFSRW